MGPRTNDASDALVPNSAAASARAKPATADPIGRDRIVGPGAYTGAVHRAGLTNSGTSWRARILWAARHFGAAPPPLARYGRVAAQPLKVRASGMRPEPNRQADSNFRLAVYEIGKMHSESRVGMSKGI